MRHEDARDADLVVQLPQPAPQLLAHLRIERAERLVEEQHAGLDGERSRERDALALAARELRGIAAGLIAQLDEIEQVADARRESASAEGRVLRGAHAQAEGDVLEDRHVPKERVVLERRTRRGARARVRSVMSWPSNCTLPDVGESPVRR